jgi:8-oxo-dGTP pyrophosphatase MutT (NUDIX family)
MIPGLIVAGGGILRRGKRLLLIHRPRRDDWSLPKGKLRNGESPLKAAIREVREETGYKPKVRSYAGCVSYLVRNEPKVVLFWLMSPASGQNEPDLNEVDETRWVTYREAMRLLSYEEERALLKLVWKA